MEEMAERVKGLEQAMEQASREVLSSQEATTEALDRVAALESLLKEEKAEGEALKLRIRLQESQVHALKSDASKPEYCHLDQAKTPALGSSGNDQGCCYWWRHSGSWYRPSRGHFSHIQRGLWSCIFACLATGYA